MKLKDHLVLQLQPTLRACVIFRVRVTKSATFRNVFPSRRYYSGNGAKYGLNITWLGRRIVFTLWHSIQVMDIHARTKFHQIWTKQVTVDPHTVEIYASAVVVFGLAMILTLDLWPWKLCQQCPLAWWIFVSSFIHIHPLSKEIARHARTVNWRTARRHTRNHNAFAMDSSVAEALKLWTDRQTYGAFY